MDRCVKILVVTLIVLGTLWMLVGMCMAYQQLDLPPSKYQTGSRGIQAMVSFALSATGGVICWAAAAFIHLAWKAHSSLETIMVTMVASSRREG